MIVDGILILLAIMAVVSGYRRGFLHTFFSTVGYIGGGILGLVLSLQLVSHVNSPVNRIILTVIAIFLVAEIGRRIFGSMANFFRTKILWAPFRFIDSLAGIVLELIRVVIVTYLLISLILWSPWMSARKAVAESTIYPKIARQMPHIINQLRVDIEKKFSVNLP
jgi:uncharacterized membrane protein required for colicin V production